MSCWSSEKKEKKKKKERILQSQVAASGTRRRSSSLLLCCSPLPHSHTFCSATFRRACDGSGVSDDLPRDSGFQRCGAERGKWQREERREAEVDARESSCQRLQTKEAAQLGCGASWPVAPRPASSQRGRSSRLAAGSCSPLTLPSLIAEPTSLLQPS